MKKSKNMGEKDINNRFDNIFGINVIIVKKRNAVEIDWPL
jgi:hypothetical protein